VLTKYAYLVCF